MGQEQDQYKQVIRSVALSTSNSDGSKRERHAIAIRMLSLAGTACLGLLFLGACQKAPEVRTLSGKDLASDPQVQITDLHLSAEENFLGQQVVYLDGKMTNRGSQLIRQLQVRLYFHDTLNQVVLRDEQEVLGARSEPLKPGQTREFQIRFDQIPDTWNRQVPQFEIVSLQVQ